MKAARFLSLFFVALGSSACGGDHDAPADGQEQEGANCDEARAALLGPVDAVSSGDVTVLADEDGVRELFVDATAGGYMNQATHPWTYVDLATGERVDVTDEEADGSTAWDLAFKRDVIRVNGGDSGPGAGESGRLEAEFDDFGASDAESATLGADHFLDSACAPIADETGKPLTGFSSWYDYDPATMVLSPKPLVFVVRGADGAATYRLAIESYYSAPDGSDAMTSSRYRLRYGSL